MSIKMMVWAKDFKKVLSEEKIKSYNEGFENGVKSSKEKISRQFKEIQYFKDLYIERNQEFSDSMENLRIYEEKIESLKKENAKLKSEKANSCNKEEIENLNTTINLLKHSLEKEKSKSEAINKEIESIKTQPGYYGVIESYIDGYTQGQKTVLNDLEKFIEDRS